MPLINAKDISKLDSEIIIKKAEADQDENKEKSQDEAKKVGKLSGQVETEKDKIDTDSKVAGKIEMAEAEKNRKEINPAAGTTGSVKIGEVGESKLKAQE